MKMKGWLARMGWVILCSMGLALASESEHLSEEARHVDRKEERDGLALLLSVLGDEAKDVVEDYHLLRTLAEYLLGEQEADALLGPEEFSEKEECSEEEECSEKGEYDDQCWGKLFTITQQLKTNYTLKEIRRMNIDLKRLFQIDICIALPPERKWTSEEDSLLDEAILTLDRSPEQRLLDAIGSADEDPEEAFEIVKSIIETEGVDVNLPYKGIRLKESLFLHRAAAVNQDKGLEIVRFLLDHGANIDILNKGETALHRAVQQRNIEIVKLLIDRGANVNMQTRQYDIDGWTSLHLALDYEYFKIAKVLLASGANSNIRNDKGEMPFDMAMKAGEQIDDETERRKFYEALNELHLQTP
jgi:hypothetical protein